MARDYVTVPRILGAYKYIRWIIAGAILILVTILLATPSVLVAMWAIACGCGLVAPLVTNILVDTTAVGKHIKSPHISAEDFTYSVVKLYLLPPTFFAFMFLTAFIWNTHGYKADAATIELSKRSIIPFAIQCSLVAAWVALFLEKQYRKMRRELH